MTKEQDRLLNFYQVALGIEQKGIAFYKKSAERAKNPLGKKIFKMLLLDELAHKNRIQLIYKSLERTRAWTEEWKKVKIKSPVPEKIFKELSKSQAKNLKIDVGDLSALEVGIGLELASINFYQENLSQAQEAEEKEFLKQMVQEEKGHHSLLLDLKSYLKDPWAWHLEKERQSLDGA